MVYIVEENSLEEFREKRKIPNWVVMGMVSGPCDLCALDEGHWLPNILIAECGVTFPPSKLFMGFCQCFDVVSTKVAPDS